jgi:diguanylate cyclase
MAWTLLPGGYFKVQVPAKPGSFAKRLYLPRILGSAVGFLAVAAALYPFKTPAWVWALLILQGNRRD